MKNVRNELGVIAYFAEHCHRAGLEIIDLQAKFPDAIVLDLQTGKQYLVEFEFDARNFIQHKHDPLGCHFVVCWRNSLVEFPLQHIELTKDNWTEFKYRELDEKDIQILALKFRNIELTRFTTKPIVQDREKSLISIEQREELNKIIISFCRAGDQVGFSILQMIDFFKGHLTKRQWGKITNLLCRAGVFVKIPQSKTFWATGWSLNRLEEEIRDGKLFLDYPIYFVDAAYVHLTFQDFFEYSMRHDNDAPLPAAR